MSRLTACINMIEDWSPESQVLEYGQSLRVSVLCLSVQRFLTVVWNMLPRSLLSIYNAIYRGYIFKDLVSFIFIYWLLFQCGLSVYYYIKTCFVNLFVLSAPFLYPQKTSENLTAFWCFQGVEKECIGNKPCVRYFKKKKRIFHLALRKLFRKTNIQGVRNVNFPENFAYEINEWSQT